ncbi:MAG: hypothetical protein KF787_00405 [Phycisphaeraceae bacterium]|nr:hypothetical protein [Phycisphaerae bacterium]MBX3391083.1 hypothetical protein [Phycisphaeraceae bacterium]
MSVKASVRSFERALRRLGPCAVCGGRGRYDTIIVRDGVPDREPRPCRGCGKVYCVKKITLDRREPAAGGES